MTQLSFDEDTAPAQLSLGEIVEPRSSPGRADPTARTLTDEQELAVERRREPLLLAAGAGSGKTSVLVERFVRAVREDGVAPGRILAITFTERAAGELRERVRARFVELGEREAARDTEAAFVSTFHGFCARLLRVNPLAAGLDPEFAILDEGLAARLRGQAWAGALRGFLEGERSGAVDLVAAWGADRVRAMVTGTYAELRSRGERLPRLPMPLFQPTLPVPAFSPMGPEVLYDEMFGGTPSGETSSETTHSRETSSGGVALGEVSAGEMPLGEMPAGEMSSGGMPSGKMFAGGTSSGETSSGETHAERAPGEEAEEQSEVDAEGARACELLAELFERFGREYATLKARRNAVDFDDLELGACALLQEHEHVRKAWAERFELMMVDEFQDTNPRQLAILEALERGNLFTVGDELQSIYGFRHADVSLFRARRDELAVHGGSLSLTRNFRGRKPLLDVVNAVFGERFGDTYTPLAAGRVDETVPAVARGEEAALGVDDLLEASDRPTAGEGGSGSESNGASAGEPIVDLLLTHKRGWDEDEDLAAEIAGELPPAPRWRQAEARLLAQRVAELVESGAARAGDVAVLLRAVGDLEVYERALRDRGLSTLATVGGFWGGQQVGDLLAYLRTLANPLDELALYGTLASPLVGVSSDGLALLGRAAKASRRSVWETIEDVGIDLPDVRLPPADRDRLIEFRARFQAERAGVGRRTLSQLIERALDQSGYREHVLTLSWPERRLANVHKLLRVARRYEANEGRDLRGFLDHVAHHQEGLSGPEPDAPVAAGETDAVRLMSIHAAKGLEFGVVCVADLGRAQNLGVGDLLVDGDRVGLRLARLDSSQATPSLAWAELCEQRRLAQAEEEDRILYVAMTRARERLLLSGAVDLERWPEPKLGAPSISWLGPALSAELPGSVQTLDPPVRELEVSATDGTQVRVALRLNAPATVGVVLRLDRARPNVGGDGPPLSPIQADSIAVVDHRSPSARQSVPHPPVRPDTLSYTSLTELERCSYRFYLERVLGLPEQRPPARTEQEPRKDGLEARVRGRIVHRLLETLDFSRAVAPSVQDVARVTRELGVRVAAHEREELAALLRAALDTPLAARLAAAAPGTRRELPFAFSLTAASAEPLLTGVLDILAREADGGLLVVDYKSDRVAPDEDLEAVIEREYSIQRVLYALAVLSDGAPRVEVVHWFLHRPAEPIGAVFAGKDKQQLEDTIARLVEDARARPFIVSKNPHRGLCLTCPGRSGLCSWSDADTLRERVGA